MFQKSREKVNKFVALTECRSDTVSGRVGLKNEGLVCPGKPDYSRGIPFLESCYSHSGSLIERKSQLCLCCEKRSTFRLSNLQPASRCTQISKKTFQLGQFFGESKSIKVLIRLGSGRLDPAPMM